MGWRGRDIAGNVGESSGAWRTKRSVGLNQEVSPRQSTTSPFGDTRQRAFMRSHCTSTRPAGRIVFTGTRTTVIVCCSDAHLAFSRECHDLGTPSSDQISSTSCAHILRGAVRTYC